MKTNKKELEILEKYFDYVKLETKDAYLETWTNGGVDMIVYIEESESPIQALKRYLKNFDIDEEIELYRQGKDYRDNFTITESVDDFRNWEKYIQKCIDELEQKEKDYIVIITETLTRRVNVKACNQDEAEEKVRKQYENEEIVLDYNDFSSVSYEVQNAK